MEESINKTNHIMIFFKNLILEFLLTIIFLMILAILLSTTDLNENVINPCIIFISAFSILVGSFFSSRKIGKNGARTARRYFTHD